MRFASEGERDAPDVIGIGAMMQPRCRAEWKLRRCSTPGREVLVC